MADRSHGEGIRVVGDFVYDAIPDEPDVAVKPAARGRSEGVHVVAEFVVASEADDSRSYPPPGQTVITVPTELLPAIRQLLANHKKSA